MEELPPEVRAAYEKAMATGGASFNTKIVFNGQEYASLDQMPAAQRQLYEVALKLSQDTESDRARVQGRQRSPAYEPAMAGGAAICCAPGDCGSHILA